MSTIDPRIDSSLAARLPLAIAPRRPRDAETIGSRDLRGYRDRVALTDAAVIFAVTTAAVLLRFGSPDAPLVILGRDLPYWLVALVLSLGWILLLGAYRTRDQRIIGLGAAEYRRVTSATGMLFGTTAITCVVLGVDVARGYIIIAFPLGLLGLLIARRSWRVWLATQRRAGRYSSTALIAGPVDDVRAVLATIERSTGSAYRPVGVLLDADDPDSAGLAGRELEVAEWTVPVVGRMDRIAQAARDHEADAVIVAGQPRGGGDFIRNLGWELERTSSELMIASRLANVAGPRIHFRPVENMPLMHVELPSYEGGKHVVKRVLDIALSALGLLVLSPLLLVVAIIVRADSPGGAMFSQDRIGRNGATFRMYKFRSMVATAEADLAGLLPGSEGNGVLFKMRSDPRVTRVGRILRKYSLDELPQLWNVLRGDMSLVGPRPPLGKEVDLYENHVLRRLYIKPGLTGMWQVNGRSNLSWEDSVRLDLYYVENWSLTGDLMILWRTVKVVLRPVGAF